MLVDENDDPHSMSLLTLCHMLTVGDSAPKLWLGDQSSLKGKSQLGIPTSGKLQSAAELDIDKLGPTRAFAELSDAMQIVLLRFRLYGQ
jgi:hypothetical protein